MENESAKELWKNFQQQLPNLSEDYDVWSFGNTKEAADQLASLVLEGLKTATCSLKRMYEVEGVDLPKVGKYSIILDANDQAVGIIQNVEVIVVPFDEFTDEMAIAESHGDRTVDYWAKVHEDLFTTECQSIGETFSTKMEIVFERFELVYAA